MNIVQLGDTAFHQVDESSRGSHDDLYAFAESTDLLFNAGTAIDCFYMDAIQVLGKVAHIISNLQAQLAGRSQYQSMRQATSDFTHLRPGHFGYPLQHGYAECRCLARTRLGQCYDVVFISQQVGNHLLLNRHGLYEPHLLNGFANLFADAQFFKCLHFAHLFVTLIQSASTQPRSHLGSVSTDTKPNLAPIHLPSFIWNSSAQSLNFLPS